MSLQALCSIHNVKVFTATGGTGRAMGSNPAHTDSGNTLKCRVRPISSTDQTVQSMRFKNRLVSHIVDFVFDPQLGQDDDLQWVEGNVTMKVEGAARDIQGLGRRWELMATAYDANNIDAESIN